MANIKRESKISLWRWVYIVPSLMLLVLTTTKKVRKEWFKKILLSYYGEIDGGLLIEWVRAEKKNGLDLLGKCDWKGGYVYIADDLPIDLMAEVFFHETRHAYQFNSWRVVEMGKANRARKEKLNALAVYLPKEEFNNEAFKLYLKLPYEEDARRAGNVFKRHFFRYLAKHPIQALKAALS